MDLKVDDGNIIPLLYRIRCDLKLIGQELDSFPWPTDALGALAYTDAERTQICAALDKAKVTYTIEAVDQPDPTILAACQGKVTSRTEALAALAAGKPPVTLETIAARVDVIESKVPAPQPIEELPSK